MRGCGYCGAENREDAERCDACGVSLGLAAESSVQAATNGQDHAGWRRKSAYGTARLLVDLCLAFLLMGNVALAFVGIVVSWDARASGLWAAVGLWGPIGFSFVSGVMWIVARELCHAFLDIADYARRAGSRKEGDGVSRPDAQMAPE